MTQTDSSNLGTVSFTTFVLSLSTATLQHLGQAGQGKEAPDLKSLPMAQQTIDILAMLKEKTQGNLSDEEEKLLGNILYDLRMRFVEASRSA